jgi:hypothetical protein
MVFKKGEKTRLGMHFSEEEKKKISEGVKKAWSNSDSIKRLKVAMKKYYSNEENREKYRVAMMKPDVYKRLQEINIGINNPMYNKHHTEKRKAEISVESKERWQDINFKELMVQMHLGEKNGNWLNGKSYEPYSSDWTTSFKKIIIVRDNNCMICGKNERLCVHHIDYNKLNSIKENCVTLCKSCHTKTNFNRKQWIEFFHSLLIEKYNYCYIVKMEDNIK